MPKVFDTAEEYASLESMFDKSMPQLPSDGDGLHHLLFTPFRYTSSTVARFRVAHDPGIWCGGVPTVPLIGPLPQTGHELALPQSALRSGWTLGF